jgi:hypothetical protein
MLDHFDFLFIFDLIRSSSSGLQKIGAVLLFLFFSSQESMAFSFGADSHDDTMGAFFLSSSTFVFLALPFQTLLFFLLANEHIDFVLLRFLLDTKTYYASSLV